MAAEQNNDAERATPKLKPCPFCASTALVLHSIDFEMHAYMCSKCGAEGPVNTNDSKAAISWNRRSAAIGEGGMPEDLAALRAEVREWLCASCNTVYPGPPAPGLSCVICPKCKGSTGPRGLMERRALEQKIADLRAQLARATDVATHFARDGDNLCKKIDDLNDQLARTSQEPVAWCVPGPNGKPSFGRGWMFGPVQVGQATMPLYAAPPLSSEQQSTQGEPNVE